MILVVPQVGEGQSIGVASKSSCVFVLVGQAWVASEECLIW